MHKNKTRYNGRYEIVNPKQDGALILSIHEVQKQPRIEVLLMRSPNRDGKKRESIHHLQLDSSFGNKSVVHMSGQSIQDSGEFRGPEQRVKSMDLVEEKSMNGSSISDLKIVVNEYRFPSPDMRADTDLTNRNLLMASSYYHFFQARKSGKFYVKVDVENLSASGAKQVTSYLFKEADLNPLIYQTKKILYHRRVIVKRAKTNGNGGAQVNVQDDPFYMPSQDDELLLLVAGADNDSGFMDSQEDRLLLEVVTNEAEDNPNKKMRVKRPKLIAKYMQKSSAKKSYRM